LNLSYNYNYYDNYEFNQVRMSQQSSVLGNYGRNATLPTIAGREISSQFWTPVFIDDSSWDFKLHWVLLISLPLTMKTLPSITALLCCLVSNSPAQVVITEFMASNSSGLADENGSYQDWIEIENSTNAAVDLFNWSLTDTAGNLNKWRFPAKSLAARARLVVFASGKDRVNPANNLHTNFNLSAGGEYLALVRPDGSVATEFAATYPPQIQNLSYGYPVQASIQTLLTTGTALRYTVPTDGSLGTTWTESAFDHTAWTAGTNGIGYDTGASDPLEDVNFPDAMAAAAPLGYWRFSETTGGTAVNSGSLGAAYNATYTGSPSLNQAGPQPPVYNGIEASNAAVGLNGSTQQVIVPDAAEFDFGTGAYAIEFWFNPTNATPRGDLFTYKGTGGDFGIHLSSQTAGKISVYHNGFIGAAGGTVTSGAWHHLVVTRNAGGTLTAYLNGFTVLTGSSTATMSIDNALVFGSNHTGVPSVPSIAFNGRMDEAALFNREVTAAEALSRYQRAVGPGGTFSDTMTASAPLGYWRASELSGTSAFNAGTLGVAANASFAGSAVLGQPGPRPPTFAGFETTNTAVGFSGTAQMIVPDATAFDMGTGPFAIEMWFNPANISARGDLFTYKGAGGDFGIHLASQVAGKISVYHGGFIGAAGGTLVNDTWYHLVVTRNSSSTLTAYLNGVVILSGTDANTMNIANSPVFGSNHTGVPTTPSAVFNGKLDEMAIYNREVSATEAQLHFQRGSTVVSAYAAHINTNVQTAVNGVNSGVYVRIPFTLANAAEVDRLNLRMKYDDGFVAYVNGHAVLDVNAPDPVVWNSTATARHPDSLAINYQEFEFGDGLQWLQDGPNVLAIHVLNITSANYDLLCSAELIATSIAGSGATAAYLAAPTPGEINVSGTGTPGPVITQTQFTPAQPVDVDDIVVTARVRPSFSPLTSVSLNYRVMYGTVIQVPMLDDGAHGDGAAGDSVYGASIPATASVAGEMVRWYITASDSTSPGSRWPLFTDPLNSAEYLGTMIKSTATATIPLWEWFTQNTTNARNATGTRCAVFFNGQLYDNAFVRVRGAATSAGSQKFDFNTGDHCYINPELGRVGEVNLNGPGSDGSLIRHSLAFETYRLTGHPACVAFPIVLRVNNATDRVGYYVEQVDDDFLKRNNLDEEGAMYKFIQRGSTAPVFSDVTTGIEKKTRKTENFSDLQAFVTGLNQADANARRVWFWDNVNAPSLLNLLALSRITQDSDDVRKNFYLYRDTNGNREWSIFPWDKDWTFGVLGDSTPHLYHPYFGDATHGKQPTSGSPQWNRLWDFVFNDATLQPLAMRRLRTLMDEYLQPPGTVNGKFEQRANAWMAALAPNVPTTTSGQLTGVLNFFPGRRTDLFITYSVASGSVGNQLIPNAQPTTFPVTIASLEFNPASGNQEEEYIQLSNPGTDAADISGWKLDGGVSMTFDPGTVIPAGGSIYASPNSYAFRARTSGPRGGQQLQVQDRYNGQISARGETIELRDVTGALVTSIATPAAPTAAQQQLRISELNFAPAPPSGTEATAIPGVSAGDFEFIELQNIGTTGLELNGCHFERGFTFAFTTPTLLPAGGRIILVSNAAAFALRHPTVTPAGQYAGNLDNSGETIQLVDGVGEVIIDFRYEASWFPPADAAGRTLVARETAPNYATYDAPTHWALSGNEGGSPGAAETDFANVYEGWRWDHFTGSEIYLPSPPNPANTVNDALVAPEANDDLDALNNLGEYAFGTNPRVPQGDAIISSGSITIGPDTFATVTFRRRHKALDLTYAIEFSSDLTDWITTTEQVGPSTDLGNGMEEITFRDTLPNPVTRRFVHVQATKVP
jgi:hypothetical protein